MLRRHLTVNSFVLSVYWPLLCLVIDVTKIFFEWSISYPSTWSTSSRSDPRRIRTILFFGPWWSLCSAYLVLVWRVSFRLTDRQDHLQNSLYYLYYYNNAVNLVNIIHIYIIIDNYLLYYSTCAKEFKRVVALINSKQKWEMLSGVPQRIG
jgi:hypothetical protein